MKIHGWLCLSGLVVGNLLGFYGESDEDPAKAEVRRGRDGIQNIIHKIIKRMWCLSRESVDVISLQRFWLGLCLVGTSGLRQPSFLFAEKYNHMWAHCNIFTELAHD